LLVGDRSLQQAFVTDLAGRQVAGEDPFVHEELLQSNR